MNNRLQTETPINKRTTISISRKNYLILKKLGYILMSMNDVLDKVLSHQTGVYRIELEESEGGVKTENVKKM